MARGGKRPGSGRPKGSLTKRSQEIAAAAAEAGIMPLDYMLAVLRDPTADPARRDDMAKSAAPYLHPRLQAIQHTGKDGGPIETTNLSDTELARKIAFLLTKDTK